MPVRSEGKPCQGVTDGLPTPVNYLVDHCSLHVCPPVKVVVWKLAFFSEISLDLPCAAFSLGPSTRSTSEVTRTTPAGSCRVHILVSCHTIRVGYRTLELGSGIGTGKLPVDS